MHPSELKELTNDELRKRERQLRYEAAHLITEADWCRSIRLQRDAEMMHREAQAAIRKAQPQGDQP